MPIRLTCLINTTDSFREKIVNSNIGNAASRIFSHLDATVETLDLTGVIGNDFFLIGWTIVMLVTLFLQSGSLALRWLIQRYNHRGGRHG